MTKHGNNQAMQWTFSKMHGAGNDFVVLDGLSQTIEMTAQRARAIAHRQFGIGCDQILLVDAPTDPNADFRYRIFNSDGSEVEHCGNGARCFVRFVHERKLSSRNPIRAEIATGLITLTELEDGQVRVEMGQTKFEPADVSFDINGLETRVIGRDTQYALPLDGLEAPIWLSLVAISNPHAVQVVEDVNVAPVSTVGPAIESHPRFAKRVNAGFMQIIDEHHIRLRVYERGAGETLACGTGACAAVASGIRQGLLQSPVRVQTRGGELTIEWDGLTLQMSGPATTVFEGQIDIDALVKTIPTF
ncbi:MAG: diaminopimelate epimerase [Burkholderiaceae bacterium]|nr:diaminopimelate epimerase [Burkholderiaceae bacterium]MCD8517924.1 diaminopimelate epimerase [Burkholderiaceae bacterium]MCD8536542.1 diaminopimelate epimerase [Burkholderiaceae bacterium]MCD8565337.1 diaminopimelate epimerase [Burkholderiaceae bacterium]